VTVLTLAAEHAVARRRTAAATVLSTVREWRGMTPADLSTSWTRAGPRITAIVTAGQRAAAGTASDYISAAVSAQDRAPDPAGAIDPGAFAGIAADGRDLASLLTLPLITTKQAIGAGASPAEALARGERLLRMLADTEVADAGRAADGAAITADRTVTTYVRVVSGSACGRCAVLAGRTYRAMQAFRRHPHCHCQHVPSVRGVAPHLTDPRSFFDHLSAAQQDRSFTVAGAQAIRDGADIGQVVNARRGMNVIGSWSSGGVTHRGTVAGSDLFGHQLATTNEGITRRGLYAQRAKLAGSPKAPARLTPEAIYRIASDREDAVRLLYRYGYLL
jgi:hypothetical protein